MSKCSGYKKDCDNDVYNHTHGLCKNCYSRWYYHEKMDREQRDKRKQQKRDRYNILYKYDDVYLARRKAHSLNSAHKGSDKLDIDRLTQWVLDHENDTCPYCGRQADSVDHKMPLSRGGRNVFANLQMVCTDCNRAKWDKTDKEFKDYIAILSN